MANYNILECFVCNGCTKKQDFLRDVKSVGSNENISFVVKNSQTRYLLNPLTAFVGTAVHDFINSQNFIYEFIPKFGNYEFEEYIAMEFRKAIFITHNLTDLFNTDIECNGTILTSQNIACELQTKLLLVSTNHNTFTYDLDYDELRKLVS